MFNIARVARGVALSLALFALGAHAVVAQTDCGLKLGNASTALPANTGTLPPAGDMSLGGNSNYLYVQTQWGWARAALTTLNNQTNPGPYNLVNVGLFQSNGGVIQINCDCEQGWNTGDVAEAPDGTARMIGDWYPYALDQSPPLSGDAAQVAMTTGGGPPAFGQQIDLSAKVALGGRVAVIYIPPNGSNPAKYYGYFPVSGSSVSVADITAPTGNASANGAIEPSVAIGWQSGAGSAPAVRLQAMHVSIPAYDKYLLVGSTGTSASGYVLHVAEINTANGTASEVGSTSMDALPAAIEIGVVENRIFIFTAESAQGLRVHEYLPGGTLLDAGTIAGDYRRAIIRGPGSFPALLAHRYQNSSQSFIDVFDTKWLTQGGSAQRAMSLPHFGATDAPYRGVGFEALVTQSGSQLLAFLYRETTTAPQQSIHTDKLDISCIAADPTSPPLPNLALTNLTAQAQGRAINYVGDKWQVKDASVSVPVIDQIQWDMNLPSGNAANFAPDAAFTGAYAGLSTINPAYLPCDPTAGGNPATGVACWASAGAPSGGNFYVGVNTHNVNGWGVAPVVAGQAIALPHVNIVGYDGQNLLVLSGGNGDASGSQGNVAEASFTWNFTCSPSCGQLTGPTVAVPTAATAFSLVTKYKGDYSVTTSGGVQQVDLVPAFSITSSLPALVNSSIAIKNLMQKGPSTSLNSVEYAITTSSAPPSSWTSLVSCAPPAGFCNANGAGAVTAPASAGSYYLQLRYNFTGPHGNGQLLSPAPIAFATTTFAPSPALVVCKNNSIPCTSPVAYFGSYSLITGTTYYLSDGETLPGGVPHPGSSYWKSSNQNPSTAGDQSLGTAPGAGPVSYTAVDCTSSCFFKIEVPGSAGTIKAYPFSASTGGCGSNCGPPPTTTLSLSGPTTGTTAAPATFTATTSNYPGAAVFTWDYGDTASGGGNPPPPPPPGSGCPPGVPPGTPCVTAPPPTMEEVVVDAPQATDATAETNLGSHTYVNLGTHTVSVNAAAGNVSLTKTWSITITQGGPAAPSNAYTVTGASINPFNGQYDVDAGITVTLASGEAHAASWAWDFGDGSQGTGQTVTHAFRAAGAATVNLTITGDGTTNQGTNTAQIKFTVAPPSFQAIMIPGAGSILADSGNWATDLSVTNPGTAPMTITLYFASFSDDIPKDLSTLHFDSLNSIPLGNKQSWSGVDVVGSANILNRPGAGKGILLLKFEGGNATPIVTARVYFTSQGSSFGTALPSFVTGPFGAPQAQAEEAAGIGQMLIGLRNDSLYRFNMSLFNASSEGGLFHVDAFSEDGAQVASHDFAVPAYSQAGVNDTDVISSLDPSKRYILKATSTTGSLQAYASSLDRRNNDLVQVSDDTPRFNVPPDTQVNYYMPGVGRIEDEASNAHWRTDLRFYNPSTLPRTVYLEYHYTPTGADAEAIVTKPLQIAAKQGVSIDDVVGNFLDDATEADLRSGTILGLLKVFYAAPTDVATAPLIIGGRIYADLSTGTAGMQLSVYTDSSSISAGSSVLIMPGAQTNLRFRTNIGLFALGTLPTTVRIHAFKQDGTETSSYDFTLNDGGHGAFAQIPMTALPTIDGNPMTIRVEALNGSRIGSYIVTVDQISADTVFIQGKPIS